MALLEQLLRSRPKSPRDRKMHPKRYAARALGINRSLLTRYIEAGVIRTTRWGKLDRISEEELQRHLEAGLPELPGGVSPPPPAPRRRALSPRPVRTSSPSAKPGDPIRALRIT